MIKNYSFGNVTWYDLESPNKDEMKKISDVYHLDEEIENELLTPTLKPKVDRFEEYIYLILHFPAPNSHIKSGKHEIDFVIGKKFIITTHYNKFDPLHSFLNERAAKQKFIDSGSTIHGGHVFFEMLHGLYKSLIEELNVWDEVLAKAEKRLFQGNERGMLITLSKINRDLLDFKAATNLHKSVLESFEKESIQFFGESFDQYNKEIINEYFKIYSKMQESKDFLEELRRTNDSLLTNKQNETMKTLTIMAFVTFPLTLISSIFGMNTDYLPIVGRVNDFWYVMGIMISLAICFFIFFKYKRWL